MNKRLSIIVFIVLSILVFDQITKHLVKNYIGVNDSIEILPFLHIVNVRNTGAAFGMFKWMGSKFFIAISFFAIFFVIIMLKRSSYNAIGLSLILGGALGNLIDRLLYGSVIDFIDIFIDKYHWPAFNVADSSLTIGIAIILITSVIKKR